MCWNPILYGTHELIFTIFPDKTAIMNYDKQKYKSILLATNTYRRGYYMHNPIMGNREHKYMNIFKLTP